MQGSMLAYYVEWQMRQRLPPLLFDDEDLAGADTERTSVVAPAQVSVSAGRKAARQCTDDGMPVQSFRTLLRDLVTLTKNRVVPRIPGAEPFDTLTRPTELQAEAFRLLGSGSRSTLLCPRPLRFWSEPDSDFGAISITTFISHPHMFTILVSRAPEPPGAGSIQPRSHNRGASEEGVQCQGASHLTVPSDALPRGSPVLYNGFYSGSTVQNHSVNSCGLRTLVQHCPSHRALRMAFYVGPTGWFSVSLIQGSAAYAAKGIYSVSVT